MAILHVDHIYPKAEGGTDETENLVTACSECNLGKGMILLQVRPAKMVPNVKARREQQKQLLEFNKYLGEKAQVENEWLFVILDKLHELSEIDSKDSYFPEPIQQSIRCFLKKLACQQVLEFLDLANSRRPFSVSFDAAFRYFCGICWTTIRRMEAGK